MKGKERPEKTVDILIRGVPVNTLDTLRRRKTLTRISVNTQVLRILADAMVDKGADVAATVTKFIMERSRRKTCKTTRRK